MCVAMCVRLHVDASVIVLSNVNVVSAAGARVGAKHKDMKNERAHHTQKKSKKRFALFANPPPTLQTNVLAFCVARAFIFSVRDCECFLTVLVFYF